MAAFLALKNGGKKKGQIQKSLGFRSLRIDTDFFVRNKLDYFEDAELGGKKKIPYADI